VLEIDNDERSMKAVAMPHRRAMRFSRLTARAVPHRVLRTTTKCRRRSLPIA